MIKLHDGGVSFAAEEIAARCDISPDEARRATITYKILSEHDTPGGDGKKLRLSDALASHDITYGNNPVEARARAKSSQCPMCLQTAQQPVRGRRHNKRRRPHVRAVRR